MFIVKAKEWNGEMRSIGKVKKVIKRRIKNIIKPTIGGRKKIVIPFLVVALTTLLIFLNIQQNAVKSENVHDNENNEIQEQYNDPSIDGITENDMIENVKLSIPLSEYYIKNPGDAGNLYYIDEHKTLWGCGDNEFGQLGQGSQDWEFHEEMVKIAENVIHVDYSQKGFTIYLTEDNKLYGFGNGGVGALQQLEKFSGEEYCNGTHYAVTKPVLLLEDVVYARCGRDDIVAMKSDASVWTWGTLWYYGSSTHCYVEKPKKILENAVLLTGGLYNHAALLEDGTVWTWGYNYAGNCGISDEIFISQPRKVAEDIIMVWTDATPRYHVEILDIAEFAGEYPRGQENTIIQKKDGSYWICGLNVGTEEKILPIYFETTDITVICTHEFLPYDMK